MSVSEQNALSLIDSIDTNAVTRTLQKIAQFQQIIQSTLKLGHDYGIIPGCQKPSLLKPGAEKINMLMGCSTEYAIMDKTEDYDKGFFAYNVKCIISRNGILITEGVGHCNSREKKYVFQDPYSITNTILKMAKKRSYIDATLTLASLSEIFTQDIEDMELPASEATHSANRGKAPGEVVVTFGKNKGKTLAELYQTDKGYFSWLMANNDRMKPHCEAYIKSLSQPPGEQEPPKDDTTPTDTASSDASDIKWDNFWKSVGGFGFDEVIVHDFARTVFNKSDLQSLTEVITTQKQLNNFLSQLAKKKAGVA